MTDRPRLDQIVAGYADGDAISTEARALKELFGRLGFVSEIFASPDRVSPAVRHECRPVSEFRAGRSDAVLYHYAIASPAEEAWRSSPARKIFVYHNVTPAAFFKGFDDRVAASLGEARARLKESAARADAVWAVSRFDAGELSALGVRNVRVFPLIFSPAALDVPPDPAVRRTFAEPMKNILFVGRIAPNKCLEELIQAFAWYHRGVDPFSRLILVGSKKSAPRYYAMLRMLAGELKLSHVCFEDFASPAALSAYYRLADVFVCPSRHEGYCLPLLEAMHQDVPVIARSTGGTPEAMGGAGVMYEDLSAGELAELIRRVLDDPGLRREILSSQEQRMERELARSVEYELQELLGGVFPQK